MQTIRRTFQIRRTFSLFCECFAFFFVFSKNKRAFHSPVLCDLVNIKRGVHCQRWVDFSFYIIYLCLCVRSLQTGPLGHRGPGTLEPVRPKRSWRVLCCITTIAHGRYCCCRILKITSFFCFFNPSSVIGTCPLGVGLPHRYPRAADHLWAPIRGEETSI